MKLEPQFITAPGGERLVVITQADYEALLEAREDADDLAAALDGLDSVRREGAIPAVVSHAIRNGDNPVQAWRKFRGYSQAELGKRAGLAQTAVARLEAAAAGAGRSQTRRQLADALDAPVWALG